MLSHSARGFSLGVIVTLGLLSPILFSRPNDAPLQPLKYKVSAKDQSFTGRTSDSQINDQPLHKEPKPTHDAKPNHKAVDVATHVSTHAPPESTRGTSGLQQRATQHRADLAEAMLPGYKYTPVSPLPRVNKHVEPVTVAPEEYVKDGYCS